MLYKLSKEEFVKMYQRDRLMKKLRNIATNQIVIEDIFLGSRRVKKPSRKH